MLTRFARLAATSGLAVALTVGSALVAHADKAAAPLIWKVSGKTATAYVLGSIHLGDATMYPLDARIDEAFAAADALVLEVPMDAASQRDAAARMLQAAQLPAGTTLGDRVSKDIQKHLAQYATKLGLPMVMFDALQPWAIGVMITMIEAQRAGYSQEFGVDQHFVAMLGDRDMLGLETIEENLALFEGLTHEQSEAFLHASLIDAKQTATRLKDMVRAWKAGDAKVLEDIVKQASREQPELKVVLKALLDDRNVRMAERLDALMRKKRTYFVVVGAGHVVGEASVPALMQRRGYTVDRVPPVEAP